ncbi:hypothetical protein [Pseudomonas sp. SDO55104_S430]
MKDIKSGRDINIHGDLTINDNSPSYKLLIHCSNEELIEEEKHRRRNLNKEKTAKFRRFIPIWAFSALALAFAAFWFWLHGKMDVFSLLIGVAGLILGFSSLNMYEKPNEFEQRQNNALEEIHNILRDRDAR